MNSSIELPEYAVTLSRKGKTYYLRIPQLHLYVQGNDLEQAYEEIAGRQREVFAVAKETGTLDELPLPTAPASKTLSLRDFLPFAVKSAIVAAIVGIVVMVIAVQVQTTMARQVAKVETMFSQISGPIGKLSKGINILMTPESQRSEDQLSAVLRRISDAFLVVANAAGSLTPERQKELAAGMRRLALALKPIIDEARLLIDDGGPAPCASGAAGVDCPPATKGR